ncbi:MAG: PAC2 family protein [Methanotrichaceae archaeon]|nr:PAC2 family protein [Methanotrichaceae archaeon]
MLGFDQICVGGLPGIGSVGKVAADYLGVALDSQTVATIHSSGFPPQVMVDGGLVHIFRVEINVPKERPDLLILSGDAQPLDVGGMYSLAGEILSQARDLGAGLIITMAAYVGDSKHKVLGVASDAELARSLEDVGVHLLKTGFIGGLNGLLVGMAPSYGLKGLCLLGSSSGDLPVDIEAACNILEVVARLLDLEIALDGLTLCSDEDDLEPVPQEFDINYR